MIPAKTSEFLKLLSEQFGNPPTIDTGSLHLEEARIRYVYDTAQYDMVTHMLAMVTAQDEAIQEQTRSA